MSNIKSLKIKNFKCFRELDIGFKNMTILAGGNACGKSSIIQILRYINQVQCNHGQWIVNTRLDNQDFGMARNLISNLADEEIINASIQLLRDNIVKEYNIELCPNSDDEYSFIVNGDNLEDMSTALRIYHLNADRCAPKTVHEIGDVSNWYVGSYGEYAISLFNHLNILSKDATSKEYVVDNLNKTLRARGDKLVKSFDQLCEMWMTNILGDVHLYASKIEDVPFNKLLIRNNVGECVPAATGFGISYCLPIVIQGLAAAIKRNCVLIVENPEAHLHPFGQSKMGQFLALLSQSGVQVIIETHSEHIINGVRLIYGNKNTCNDSNIIFFGNQKGQYFQNEITINEVGDLSKWPEGFFDQTERDIQELLKRKFNGDNN